MHKRIDVFLKDNNILYYLQFRFQENISVDHALISMTEALDLLTIGDTGVGSL